MSATTANIITLGCRLNQADSGWLAETLRQAGFTLVPPKEKAELIVVNSCTVTQEAARKTRQAARAARNRSPGAFIVITGCDPTIDQQNWHEEPAVDLILSNAEKQDLLKHLPADLFSVRPGNSDKRVGCYPHRTRANLKVQEGCDFFCSYCIVPYARGEPRSRPAEEVLIEAHELLKRGHRELVLTGINLACYHYEEKDLVRLVQAIISIPGEFRIRLSSIEPTPAVPALIELIRDNPKKICRFLHLPLQYGENGLLQAMNRKYQVEEFINLTQLAVAQIPGIHLGTDIMVGFPGETEGQFETCLKTVRSLPLANLHVFRYSPRPGTPAAGFPEQVPPKAADKRYQTLQRTAEEKKAAFAENNLGKELPVLIETMHPDAGGSGWSDNYSRVNLAKLPRHSQGRLVRARIINKRTDNQLEGEMVCYE